MRPKEMIWEAPRRTTLCGYQLVWLVTKKGKLNRFKESEICNILQLPRGTGLTEHQKGLIYLESKIVPHWELLPNGTAERYSQPTGAVTDEEGVYHLMQLSTSLYKEELRKWMARTTQHYLFLTEEDRRANEERVRKYREEHGQEEDSLGEGTVEPQETPGATTKPRPTARVYPFPPEKTTMPKENTKLPTEDPGIMEEIREAAKAAVAAGNSDAMEHVAQQAKSVMAEVMEAEVLTDDQTGEAPKSEDKTLVPTNTRMFEFLDDNGRAQPITTIVDQNGEPWFVADEICKVLGYANTRDAVSRHLKSHHKNSVVFHDGITKRGNPNKTIINEPGFYRLAMRSKMPGAEKFQDWVEGTVLPSLRKTGRYEMEQLSLDDKMELLAKSYLVEREKTKLLTQKIEEDKPKVEFRDQVISRNDLNDWNKTAKLLGCHPASLREALWKRKVLNANLEPTTYYCKMGYFELRANATNARWQVYVTNRGVEWLARWINNKKLKVKAFVPTDKAA